MFRLALRAIRSRRLAFIGMFSALTLGVALMAAMGMVLVATLTQRTGSVERYAAVPSVVRAAPPIWARELATADQKQLALDTGLTPDVIAATQALGHTVIDRVFPVYGVDTNQQLTGRPWSAVQLAPHTLVAGRDPHTASEIAVPQGAATLGQQLTVVTAAQTGRYTVVGLVSQGSDSSLFFHDEEAARLSPRVDALASFAPETEVRQHVGDKATVLTGDARRELDPSAQRDRQALINTRIVAALTAGVVLFVSVFVVASTFAFTVAQRRREFALLRMLGALPVQIRRLVYSEALIVGTLAAIAGCLIGVFGSKLITQWFITLDVAPQWLTPPLTPLPLLAAVGIGVGVAFLGARSASAKAASVSPLETVRDVVSQRNSISLSRGVWGGALLVIAIVAMVFVALIKPFIVTLSFMYIWVLLLPLLGIALLTPYGISALVTTLMLPVRRSRLYTVIRGNLVTSRNRTASLIAPILLTVGLSVSLLGAIQTTDQAARTEAAEGLRAPYVVTPTQGGILSYALTDALNTVPGVSAYADQQLTVYGADEEGALRSYDARAVDAPRLETAHRISMQQGSFRKLRKHTVVVSAESQLQLGQHVVLTFANHTTETMEVVGVTNPDVSDVDVYLSSEYRDPLLPPSQILVSGSSDQLNDVQQKLQQYGSQLISRDAWLAGQQEATLQAARAGLLILLGLTVTYCFLSIINILVLSGASRLRDFATLRLAGATLRQVLWVATAESVLIVVAGILLAAITAGINFAGLLLAVTELVPTAQLVIPWKTVGAILAAVVVVAVLASVLPIYLGSKKALSVDRQRE